MPTPLISVDADQIAQQGGSTAPAGLLMQAQEIEQTIRDIDDRGAAVANASGGSTVDAEARTAINALLARLRTHGLIAT